MHEEPFEEIETQLDRLRSREAPVELRQRVLSRVHRELTAARWDRRFARAAALLLVVGVGMNLGLGLVPPRQADRMQLAGGLSQEALVDAGVTMAEATDPRTGRQFARHLAILSGVELTAEQGAAIDRAIERRFLKTDKNLEREG